MSTQLFTSQTRSRAAMNGACPASRSAVGPRPAARLSTVFCYETGGTIACTESAHGRRPTVRMQDAIDNQMPWAREIAELIVPEADDPLAFGRIIDSTDMAPRDWCQMVDQIGLIQHTPINGIVVTEGTDTMTSTAPAVHLGLGACSVPVVLTGSMLPCSDPETDAHRNFGDAVYAATRLSPGVYVVFHGRILDPLRLAKLSSTDTDAFRSATGSDIGRVDWQSGLCEWTLPRSPQFTQDSPGFDSRIEVIRLVPGHSQEHIDRVRRCTDVHGVIIQGFGAGGIPAALTECVRDLAEVKPVVACSQCPTGGTDLDAYEVGHHATAAGVLSARWLSPDAASVAMMWILAHSAAIEAFRSAWHRLVHVGPSSIVRRAS